MREKVREECCGAGCPACGGLSARQSVRSKQSEPVAVGRHAGPLVNPARDTRGRAWRLGPLLVVLLGCLQAQPAGKPETVMVTYHARAGAETALARVIARHWSTMQELKLAGEGPRLTLRGTEEGGKTYFVDIFTWRDTGIPDSAPPAIQSIWKEMGELVEARGGRQAIEIAEVSPVTPERPPLVAAAGDARMKPQKRECEVKQSPGRCDSPGLPGRP